jgi:hypothetical protein
MASDCNGEIMINYDTNNFHIPATVLNIHQIRLYTRKITTIPSKNYHYVRIVTCS